MDDYAIQFNGLSVRLGGRLVLENVTADFRTGEISGLLGPNGAGKTTLLNVAVGLQKPASGKIRVLGAPAVRGELYRRIGLVPQETALYEELTVRENLAFAASLFGLSDADARVDELLELLELADRDRDRVDKLSGGMRRRVTIARALLHRPDLLIIDEPTLGVDVEARHAIWQHLRTLRSQRVTVLVSTNYLDEALALCDSVCVLRDGRLIVNETPQALVARAGSCLDIECAPSSVSALEQALIGADGVLRTSTTTTGIAVFLDGSAEPDPVIRAALKIANITGFRHRAADLAEVFRAIEARA